MVEFNSLARMRYIVVPYIKQIDHAHSCHELNSTKITTTSDHSLIQTLTNDRDRDRSLITGRGGGGVPSLATRIQKGGHMIVLQNEKLSLSLTFTKGKKTPFFPKR